MAVTNGRMATEKRHFKLGLSTHWMILGTHSSPMEKNYLMVASSKLPQEETVIPTKSLVRMLTFAIGKCV